MEKRIKELIREIEAIRCKIDRFDWEVERPDLKYAMDLIQRGTILIKQLEELNINGK